MPSEEALHTRSSIEKVTAALQITVGGTSHQPSRRGVGALHLQCLLCIRPREARNMICAFCAAAAGAENPIRRYARTPFQHCGPSSLLVVRRCRLAPGLKTPTLTANHSISHRRRLLYIPSQVLRCYHISLLAYLVALPSLLLLLRLPACFACPSLETPACSVRSSFLLNTLVYCWLIVACCQKVSFDNLD